MDRRWMRMDDLCGTEAKPAKNGKPAIPARPGYIPYKRWTVYDWIKKHEFPCSKPTRKGLLFDKEEIDKWLNKFRVTSTKKDRLTGNATYATLSTEVP